MKQTTETPKPKKLYDPNTPQRPRILQNNQKTLRKEQT